MLQRLKKKPIIVLLFDFFAFEEIFVLFSKDQNFVPYFT